LRGSLIALLLGVIVSCVCQTVYIYITDGCNSNYDVSTYFKAFCFLIQFPGILLGISVYYVVNKYNQQKHKRSHILLLYIAFLLFSCIVFAISHKYALNVLSLRFIASAVFGIFVLHGALYYSGHIYNTLLSRCLKFLGKHSLGIYLFHMLLIRYFIKLHLSEYCQTLPIWLVGLLFMLVLSAVVGYFMEKITDIVTNKLNLLRLKKI
jgi:peptidoglycan/LPS O-acetylase OafA/YrhL